MQTAKLAIKPPISDVEISNTTSVRDGLLFPIKILRSVSISRLDVLVNSANKLGVSGWSAVLVPSISVSALRQDKTLMTEILASAQAVMNRANEVVGLP